MPFASTDTVSKLKRRVNDPASLDADAYQDAAETALSRLSFDFAATYMADTDVPFERQSLFLDLAAIELCYMLAGEHADDIDVSSMSKITVPDLAVDVGDKLLGSELWLKYAKQLEAEYQRAIDLSNETPGTVDQMPEVVVGVVARQSMRTGGRTEYDTNPGPNSCTLAASLSGTNVSVTWSAPPSPRWFAAYEVFRAATAAELEFPESDMLVQTIGDVHGRWNGAGMFRRWLDSPGSGTWYYKLAVLDTSNLRAWSAVVSATVP